MSYWPANLDRSVSSPHWQAHLYTQLCAAAIQLNVLLRQLVYCNPNCVFSELNNGRGGRGKPEWFIRLGKCFLTASLLVSSCSTHNLRHVHTHVPAAAVQSVSCPHTHTHTHVPAVAIQILLQCLSLPPSTGWDQAWKMNTIIFDLLKRQYTASAMRPADRQRTTHQYNAHRQLWTEWDYTFLPTSLATDKCV